MCLVPRLIPNPRYQPNFKNGYTKQIPPSPEEGSVLIPCGRCVECRRRRASDWRYRLLQEYKYGKDQRFTFVTLTFSDEALSSLMMELSDDGREEFPDIHAVVRVAVRRFLERYRREFGVSLRHWFVTELGETTGRIHLHGIISDCKCGSWYRGKWKIDKHKFDSFWKYGYTWLGWCNEKTISYICKYITKQSEHDLDYKSIILCSPGYGRAYIVHNWRWHLSDYKIENVKMFCVTSTGHKVAMPRYYRERIFPDDLRQDYVKYLRANPPPMVLDGIEYFDGYVFNIRKYNKYLSTISRKTSYICAKQFKSLLFNVNQFDTYGEFTGFLDKAGFCF